MKRTILDNLKNLGGWRSSRKFVVFAVDDYGGVRTASRKALARLEGAGLRLSPEFDRVDALETRQDLESLFYVLDSVRDCRNKPAIFTAYALCANPDFEAITARGDRYELETVATTFSRLTAEQPLSYEGAWSLWDEGRARRLIQPQFHGREHLNVELFERKLRAKAVDLMANLTSRSLAGISGDSSMPGVGFTHAFGLHKLNELKQHEDILAHGLDLFEDVWGVRSISFTPPARQLHSCLYRIAEQGGVKAIHKPSYFLRSGGDGERTREINRTALQRGQDHLTMVRNVLFEPRADIGHDPVEYALRQIATAFRFGKPAIISSHRANFCGHLNEKNRQRGLGALRRLLSNIARRWPDAEFVSVDELVGEMIQTQL